MSIAKSIASAFVLMAAAYALNCRPADGATCMPYTADQGMPNQDLWESKVDISVFRVVYKGPGGPPKIIGTATMIDQRGYFLTAKHILKSILSASGISVPSNWTQNNAFAEKIRSSELLLRNEAVPSGYKVKPLIDKTFSESSDAVVLISSDFPLPEEKIPAVTIYLGKYTNQCRAAFIGYETGTDRDNADHFTTILGGDFSCVAADDMEPEYEIQGQVTLQGNSGALVIDPQLSGIGIHVASGPDTERYSSKILKLWSVDDVLSSLMPDDDVSRALTVLKSPANAVAVDTALKSLSNLELLILARRVLEDSNQVQPSFRVSATRLFDRLAQSCMFDVAGEFSGVMYSKGIKVASTDTARAILLLAKEASDQGDMVLAQDVARSSVQIFEASGVTTHRESQPGLNRYTSNVLYDYGNALALAEPANSEAVFRAYVASARVDPTNDLPYSGIASIAMQRKNYALAAASAATAYQNGVSEAESSGLPLSKWHNGIVVDWNTSLAKSISKFPPDLVAKLDALRAQGIKTAPSLAIDSVEPSDLKTFSWDRYLAQRNIPPSQPTPAAPSRPFLPAPSLPAIAAPSQPTLVAP